MTPYDLLDHLRDTILLALDNAVTCKIGIEANLSAAAYPLVRLVPTRLTPVPNDDRGESAGMELTIYFGAKLQESAEGLETVYAALFGMEATIRTAVLATAVDSAAEAGEFIAARFIDTLLDEDRLPHYKLMASRFEVTG